MPFFSAEDLIVAVMERPALWDANDPGHNDKFVSKTMWNQIKRLSKAHSVEPLKKKWKNLKDQYRKELKKMPASGSGYSTKWKHFDMMSFLQEHLLRSRGESNADRDTAENDDLSAEDNDDDPDKVNLMPRTVRASSLTTSEALSTKMNSIQDLRIEFLNIQRKKLKLQEKVQRERRKRQLVRARERQDEDYHYVMTLLPQMRQFTPSQKFRVRNKINSIMLAEIEQHGQFTDTFPYDNNLQQ